MEINKVRYPGQVLYVAVDKNNIAGYALLMYLKWDSGIFGFKIGRIEHLFMRMDGENKYNFLKTIVDDCRKEKYAHINLRIGLKDFDALFLCL